MNDDWKALVTHLPAGRDPVKERRSVGRPRMAEASTTVCTRVPVGTFDRLATAARSQRVSVSEYVRRVIVLNLTKA